MAHFAQIDENNIVTRVLVIEQDVVDTGLFGEPSSFAAATRTTGSPTYTVSGGYRTYKYTSSGSITF
jgi:hypothetical protein